MPPCHVVLVGTMGAGKTTVGRLLAGRLRRPLVDSDAQIEARTGRTVAEIEAADGAEAMHRLEADVLLDSVDTPEPSVIAAAASVVTDARVLDALRSPGVRVVWLRARARTLRRRALAGTHRPFVHGDPDAAARLDAARAPLYREVADVTIDVDDAEPEVTAREITTALEPGDVT